MKISKQLSQGDVMVLSTLLLSTLVLYNVPDLFLMNQGKLGFQEGISSKFKFNVKMIHI